MYLTALLVPRLIPISTSRAGDAAKEARLVAIPYTSLATLFRLPSMTKDNSEKISNKSLNGADSS